MMRRAHPLAPSRSRRLRLAVALICLLGLVWPAGARAQTAPGRILVHTLTTAAARFPDTAVPGLKLSATLTLLEADGTVIRTPIKDGAARLSVAGLEYAGDFGILPPDWSVVWLVDASATLGNTRATADFRTARDSLTRAAQGMPDNTNVALVTFSDRAPTVQELLKDRDGLSKNMAKLQANPRGGSCLNDGLFEAVNKLAGLQGRKAVFVFTASADTCNTRPLQQVLDLASRAGVQIYAVGLEGYAVAQADLDAFTVPTGGLGLMAGLSRLGPTLDNLNAVLTNQWQVVWTLCPPAGPQTGALNLGLTDTRALTADLAFTSDQAYACPPRVEVLGLQTTTRDRLEFNLRLTNPEAVSGLQAEIINKATGRTEAAADAAPGTGPLIVPAAQLQSGADYALSVTALNAAGELVAVTAEPFQFRYEPVPPQLQIAGVAGPTLERATVIVTATVSNPANFDVQFFKAWLVTENDNAIVPGTETTVPAGQVITLPAEPLETGGYLVQAQALDGARQVQAEAAPYKLTYQRPSNLERFIYQMRQLTWVGPALWAAGGVAVVGLAALVFFLFWWPRRASRIKTVELALPEKARHSAPAAASVPVARPAEAPKAAASAPSESPKAAARPAAIPPAAAPAEAPPAAARPAETPPAAPRPVETPPAAPPAEQQRTMLALPRATLSVQEPTTVQFNAVIAKTPFKVGRRAENDAVLPVDGTSGVSGQHLVITFVRGFWYVQDDVSTYGTTLNGQPVPKGQPVRIEDGAVLGLGPLVKLQFRTGR